MVVDRVCGSTTHISMRRRFILCSTFTLAMYWWKRTPHSHGTQIHTHKKKGRKHFGYVFPFGMFPTNTRVQPSKKRITTITPFSWLAGNARLVSGNIFLSNWWVHLPHRELCDVNTLQPFNSERGKKKKHHHRELLLLSVFHFFFLFRLVSSPPPYLILILTHISPFPWLAFSFLFLGGGLDCVLFSSLMPSHVTLSSRSKPKKLLRYLLFVYSLNKVMREFVFNCLIIIAVLVVLPVFFHCKVD